MFDTPVLPRLETVLAEVRSGDLVIPQFQRPFVWDDERRLKLLDSIVAGMPIGSLLVWRTSRRDLHVYESVGGVKLGGPRKEGEKVNYLIDGHQRISTLFGALYGDGKRAAGGGTRWSVYFELGSKARPAFRVAPARGGVPPNWLPLNIILDGDRLFEFTQVLREAGDRTGAKEAERLANVFRDYIVPIVPLVTEDLNVVTDAFVRINSQGKSMGEAHMLRALTHLESIDTDKQFARVRRSLRDVGWGGLDDQVLVSVLKAQMGLDVYASDVRGVREELRKDPAPLSHLPAALDEAIKFLASVGVRGPGALPYTYQLVTLATLAAWLPGKLTDGLYAKRLRSWFWRSTYTELYSGVTGSRIREVISELHAAYESGREPQIPWVTAVKPLSRIRGATGRTRAFMLFLARLPKGRKAAIARQELLGSDNARATPSIFKGARTDPGNRVIALPSEVNELRRAIRQGTLDTSVAKKFGIPPSAIAVLPDVDAFVRIRREWLVAQEIEFLKKHGLTMTED